MAMITVIDIRNPVINILQDDTNEHTKQCRILSTTVADQRIHLHFDTVQELDQYIHALKELRQIRGS